MGRTVERPIKPSSIEISQNEVELRDPRAYPVKVRNSDVGARWCTRVSSLDSQLGAPEAT